MTHRPGERAVGEDQERQVRQLVRIAATHLFALPSSLAADGGDQTGSQAILQAGAAGLPVLAADNGSAAEFVKEGESGLLGMNSIASMPAVSTVTRLGRTPC